MNKRTTKSKLYELNDPKILIFVGGIASAIVGFCQPFFGLLLGRFVSILTVPIEFIGGPEGLREAVSKEARYTLILALIAYVASVIQKKSFSKLGEGVTYKIRCVLYSKILQKHMGWFDLRDNATSVLTATMAEES